MSPMLISMKPVTEMFQRIMLRNKSGIKVVKHYLNFTHIKLNKQTSILMILLCILKTQSIIIYSKYAPGKNIHVQ